MSYDLAAGGDPFAASEVGLGAIEYLSITPAIDAAASTHHTLIYNHATERVRWFRAGGAELGQDDDLSAFSSRFEAIGQ